MDPRNKREGLRLISSSCVANSVAGGSQIALANICAYVYVEHFIGADIKLRILIRREVEGREKERCVEVANQNERKSYCYFIFF